MAAIMVIFSIWLPLRAFGASKRFVVTTAAGGRGAGTLTSAIIDATYNGADINYIDFNIPGGAGGEIEIKLTEPLYIGRSMVINGATQSGNPAYAGPPLIRINCGGTIDSGFLIVPAGPGYPGGRGSTIQGLRIFNYRSNAITIFAGVDSNVIQNNYIGFALGFNNIQLAPLCRGIAIESSSNRIRGNTISGVDNGITLGFDIAAPPPSTARGNMIEHNFIGTDPTGKSKIGNTSDGIFLGAGCDQTVIGPGNVLSGNASAGVELLSTTATNNRIFGNMIGVNAAGTDVIPNGELGVLIANGAANNFVGGPAGGSEANVISGNGFGGVAIGTDQFPGTDGSNDNHVEGNLIGCDAGQTRAIGKQLSGVTVQTKSKRNFIRANVIVGQEHHGIVLSNASNNEVYGNWIGKTSGGLMIGNGGFGVYLFNATNNIVQPSYSNAARGKEQNKFGLNGLGPVGEDGVSTGNVIDLTPPPAPGKTASRLLNISTRMRVEAGDNALIAGFIITGQGAKKVIIRGLGPSLGIPGALADPSLELNNAGAPVFNDNWKSDPTQAQAIIDSGVPPTNDLEAAIVATLLPGAYTAILRGKGNAAGVGLVELYDLDPTPSAILANISTRGIIRTGDNVMIAGLIIGGGQADSRIVFRGLGPSLSAAGVTNALLDPLLRVVNGNGAQVGLNDNWRDDAAQAAQLTALNISPSNPFESAMVANLSPGSYTAILADKNGRPGTGLVELYHIQ